MQRSRPEVSTFRSTLRGQSRRFRSEDGVALPGIHAGGGPAAQFDPTIRKMALESARALFAHVNPETGLALRDDPVLAWVTRAGEVSLFNLIGVLDASSAPYAKASVVGRENPGRPGATFLGVRRVGSFEGNGGRPP